MKNLLPILAVAVCGSAGMAFADDFKSQVLMNSQQVMISVPRDRFLLIRNFTQDGGVPRGVVSATVHGLTGNVLAAAIVEPSTSPVEVINTAVVAGPADVTVTCGSGSTTGCFITYKKDSN